MKRNIRLAYLICFFRYTWFWLGIWIYYYLRYTDYAGIGLIETSLIISMTLSEIPTGAIADMIGKKWALLLGLLLQSIGIGILAFIPSLINIMIGVFIAGIGGSFYSGTFEALVYDSLKQEKKESEYSKVIAHIGTISLISPAVCSIIGGFMYLLWPPLPTAASSLGYLGGFMAALFLKEPDIYTEKFTFKNIFIQIKFGFQELFKTNYITKQTILFLTVGFIIVIADEMVNAFLGVEFGFVQFEIGILWAVIYLLSSLSSQLTPYLTKKFNLRTIIIISGQLLALTLIFSPIAGKYIGGISLLVRSSLQVLFLNFASIGINAVTESKYRATAISVFNMIKNIPYVFTAYFIGSLTDIYSAKIIAWWMGIFLIATLLLQSRFLSNKIQTIKE